MDIPHWIFTALLLSLILIVGRTSARCRFPAILQSHAASSWWLYHVTSGGARTSDETLYYVEFLSEQMIMTPVSGSTSRTSPAQIQRECIHKNSDKTYIVRSMSGNREYFCLRFVFHSQTVFQLETSDPFARADDTRCTELQRDPWPLIRYDTSSSDYVPCPLIGGSQMKLEDNSGNSLCDSYVMSPRLECGCEEPKGIILKLEHCKPARTILQMNYRQKLHCLAHWHDDKMGLVIITKRDDATLFWMLTMRGTLTSKFKGVISSDIILEPETKSKHSVQLTLNPVVFSSTCADLADICDDIKNHTCTDDIVSMTLCAESCGQCQKQIENKCTFKKDMLGSWLGFRGTEMFNLTVENDHIYAGEIEMRCEERDALLDTYTLVTFKDNGCYPEYKCLKVRRIFDNVVKYHYEGGPSWPVFTKDHLCTPYVTKNDIRHHQQMSLAFKAPGDSLGGDVITCDIPNGTYESRVLFSDGNVCVAVLSKQNCSEADSPYEGNSSVNINVYFNDCSLEGLYLIQYTCVMQLQTNDPSRKTVLVHTSDDPPAYYCLLYDPLFKEMVVLPASKCYDHLNSDIVATHSLTLISPNCMQGLPLTTIPTERPTTIEMTSESFYDAIYDNLDEIEGDYTSHKAASHKDRQNSTSDFNDTNSNTTVTSKSGCNSIETHLKYFCFQLALTIYVCFCGY